jgi:TonB family protein
MKFALVFRMAVLALCCATPANAQQQERFGNVEVYLDATHDSMSHALLKPDAYAGTGELVLSCGGEPGGLAAGLHLAGDSSSVPVRAVLAFDGAPPVGTVWRKGVRDVLAILQAQDAGDVLARARQAERLTVQVPAARPSRPAAEYVYTLTGLEPALARMGCTAAAAPGARSAGARTLRSMVAITEEMSSNRSLPPLGVVYEPRPVDPGVFRASLQSHFPGLLRNRRADGELILRFVVLENGRVDRTRASIVRSTHEELNGTAIRMLGRLWFHPAQVNGVVPVKAWVQLPIQFTVSDP